MSRFWLERFRPKMAEPTPPLTLNALIAALIRHGATDLARAWDLSLAEAIWLARAFARAEIAPPDLQTLERLMAAFPDRKTDG